jgi:hypothetical protein
VETIRDGVAAEGQARLIRYHLTERPCCPHFYTYFSQSAEMDSSLSVPRCRCFLTANETVRATERYVARFLSVEKNNENKTAVEPKRASEETIILELGPARSRVALLHFTFVRQNSQQLLDRWLGETQSRCEHIVIK